MKETMYGRCPHPFPLPFPFPFPAFPYARLLKYDDCNLVSVCTFLRGGVHPSMYPLMYKLLLFYLSCCPSLLMPGPKICGSLVTKEEGELSCNVRPTIH